VREQDAARRLTGHDEVAIQLGAGDLEPHGQRREDTTA